MTDSTFFSRSYHLKVRRRAWSLEIDGHLLLRNHYGRWRARACRQVFPQQPQGVLAVANSVLYAEQSSLFEAVQICHL